MANIWSWMISKRPAGHSLRSRGSYVRQWMGHHRFTCSSLNPLLDYCWLSSNGPEEKIQWNMMTSSNGNIFCVTGPLSLVTGEFPSQRPVTRSFDVFFDLRLNKRLSKQSWGWWFRPSPSLWRHCNDQAVYNHLVTMLVAHLENQYAFYSPFAPFE